MKFIRFFTDRPIATLMVYSVLTLLGVVSFLHMPVDLMPGGDAGILTVFVGIRGGLPPTDIESLVTKPIEDAMATLPNLKEMTSVSRKERAVVSLSFKPGVDTKRMSLEVQERLAKIKGKLPKEIEKPVVSRYDENQSPVMILAMSSKHFTPEDMRDIADNQLKPLLKRLPGVANIEIGGGRERKILVEFDQDRLEAYALPIRQVISQIGMENLNALTGKMDRETSSYFVRAVGAYRTIHDLEELPIAVTKEGSRLRLKDVAQVKDYYSDQESYSRMNREPVVSTYIQKEAMANTIETCAEIKKAVDEYKKTLDPRINFQVVTDQSIAIQKALKEVKKSLLEGACLAGIVLIVFLRDFLSASFIFVSIPMSMIVTCAVMDWTGISLNVMTISGMALASGMIVDDSIVVLENIEAQKRRLLEYLNRRRLENAAPPPEGPPKEKEDAAEDESIPNSMEELVERLGEKESLRLAPVYATGEMILAVSASTLTKVIVFLPIIFLNAEVKQLYMGLAITVSASLMISLLVSMTIIPCLASNVSPTLVRESSYWSTYFWLFLMTKLKRLSDLIERIVPRVRHLWRKAAKRVLKRPDDPDPILASNRPTRLFKFGHGLRKYRHTVSRLMRWRYPMAALIFVLFAASLFIYTKLDKEFVGKGDENEFTIFVELPSGAKLDVSDKVVRSVEKLLADVPEVQKSVKTQISRVEGWSSKIYVTLNSSLERTRSVQDVINQLRPLLSKIGGQYSAFVYCSEPESSKEFVVECYGPDYDKLRDMAVQVSQRMEKVKGLVDVKLRYKPGQPEVRIEMDRQRAAAFGLTVNDIAMSLHAEIRGLRATYFMTPTAQIETIARLQEQYRKNLEDIENLSVINQRGVIVPLRQFATFEFGLTPSEVWRKGRERTIQASASRQDVALSKVATGVLKALQGIQIPPGYYFEIGGDFPKMMETEKQSRYAFLMMIMLVFTVLASQFESYAQPILILVAVPLCFIGATPLLYVTKTPVTLGTLIGFIMLGGISVGNSIILIDVFNHLHKTRRTLRALMEAGQERLRPIVMTTLTTTLGLVPMLLGGKESGSLWAPLAMTVIGGIIVSTILILFVLPAFYLILQDTQNWTSRKLQELWQRLGRKKTSTRPIHPVKTALS